MVLVYTLTLIFSTIDPLVVLSALIFSQYLIFLDPPHTASNSGKFTIRWETRRFLLCNLVNPHGLIFKVHPTLFSTLVDIDKCQTKHGHRTERQEEGKWHVVVSGIVDDCRTDEGSDKRRGLADDREQGKEEELTRILVEVMTELTEQTHLFASWYNFRDHGLL